MRPRHYISQLMLLLGVLALGASTARADNTTLANADFILLGEVQASMLGPGATTRFYKAGLTSGRSYVVYVWAPNTDPSETPVSMQTVWTLDDGSAVGGQSSIGSNEPPSAISTHTGDTRVFTPTTTGTFRLAVSSLLAPTATHPIRILVIETTVFSPWWFVDKMSGYEGFVELRNNTAQPLTVVVTARNSAGATLGTAKTVIIPANGSALLRASSDLGTGDGFGTVDVAHNGTPGALAANITTLSPTTGLSFDAPFIPRMEWATMASSSVGPTGPTGPTGNTGSTGAIGPAGAANINGTINRLIKFTAATTGGDSQIFDNGTNIGIKTLLPSIDVTLAKTAGAVGMAIGHEGAFNDPESGRLLFHEHTTDVGQQGINVCGFQFHHDGAANLLHLKTGCSAGSEGTSRIAVMRDGNVGIGTTTPGFLLEVNGTAGKPGGGSWSVASDARLKDRIQPFTDGLDTLLRIDPVRYHYSASSGLPSAPEYVGVIAQEIQKVAPYMVSPYVRSQGNGVPGDSDYEAATSEKESYLSVDPSALDFVLINAVKEQQRQIEGQQRLIDELRRELDALKQRR